MKNLMFVFVTAALAFSGCKKKGGADCEKAIDHSMDLSKADMTKQPGMDDKMIAKMRDIGVQHCKDDKWSDDARNCMADAKTEADAQACFSKLTQDQQQKMTMAAMAAAQANAPAPTPAGSAAAPEMGSAAAGSAAAPEVGSAAAGSAATK